MSTSDDWRASLGSAFAAKKAGGRSGEKPARGAKPEAEAPRTLTYPQTPEMPKTPKEAGTARAASETSGPKSAPAPEPLGSREPAAAETPEVEEGFGAVREAAGRSRAEREETERADHLDHVDAWLASAERDRNLESAEGFDFLEDDDGPVAAAADEWPAFDDVDTEEARRRKARIDAEAARIAAAAQPPRQVETKALRRFAGALAVLLVAATAGFGLSTRDGGAQTIGAPVVEAAPEPDSLSCVGAFRRTLETGMDVHDVDEKIVSGSTLFAEGPARAGDLALGASGLQIHAGPAVSGPFKAEDAQTTIAGSFAHVAEAGDMRGAASVACGRAVAEQYLTGSQTAVGTSNELILFNPGPVPVRVHVEAVGSAGELSLSSVEQVVVDAAGAKRVLLDGVAESDTRVAFRVSTQAGAVYAALQETVLEGATPAGVSFVPGGQAGRRLVIPAVASNEGADSATLRVANWGQEPATVSAHVLGVAGPSPLAGLESVAVAPQTVIDVPLGAIDGAIGSVVVEADAAVSAGVQLARSAGEGAPREIAWAAPVQASAQLAGTIGARGGRLTIAADEAASVSVVAYDASGTAREPVSVKVGAGHGVPVEIPAGAVAVRVEASAPVYAGVVTESALPDGQAIDWLALLAPRAVSGAQRITVQ